MSEAEDSKPLGRPFPKGRPGCLAGRRGLYPPEERYRRRAARKLPAITDKVIEQALRGDMQAAALVFKYALAPPKEPCVVLDLPVDCSLAEQAAALMQACAQGKLAPSQTAQLLMGLASHAKVIEIDELVREVDEIKRALAEQGVALAFGQDRAEKKHPSRN